VARPVAVITGAARGIGLETARQLSATHRVALLDRDAAGAERAAAQIGADAVHAACDITDADAVASAVADVVERCGGIDVAIANAGIATAGALRHLDPDVLALQVDVNLVGNWRFLHACLPHVIERRGYVLCIASIYALLHGPAVAAYAMSKSGVEAFADTLRVEVKARGVDVGVAYYSFLDTDLVRGAMENPAVQLIRSRTPWPLSATSEVGPAVEAAARGIERRSRAVHYPRWVRALVAAHGVIQPLFEPFMARNAEEPVRMLNDAENRRGPR